MAAPKDGPGNPRPLSVLRTELVWEGKHDELGNRREMDAASLALASLLKDYRGLTDVALTSLGRSGIPDVA
jgi:hypothetical protein